MYEALFHYFSTKTDISPEEFQEITPYFHIRKVVKNEFLLMEGEVCHYNYFVRRGCLRLFSIDDLGQEHTRYFAFENKFGTALTSFIQQKASIECIQALENSEVLAIRRPDFFFLVETVPALNIIYRDILEMAYTTSQERIYNFQGKSALERLKWLLDYQPDILDRLTNQVVASYLGVTPYTLSRLKAEL